MKAKLQSAGYATLLLSTAAVASGTPHVVMIMADDWGWSDIAAYRRYQGLSDPIPTPHLDRLVAGGMMFTDAHSPAALCAPTRFSMMTGSYPYRNGVQWGTWNFTGKSAFSNNRKHVTVGEVMQSAGYRTAFFGKMHFGGGSTNYAEKMPAFPTTYGFNYVFSAHGGIQAPPYLYFENDRFVKIDPDAPLNPSVPGALSDVIQWTKGSHPGANGGGSIDPGGDGDPHWNSSQNGIINSRKASAFIRNHLASNPETPFLLYYCMPQIHIPHTPPIDFEPGEDGLPGSPPNAPVAGATAGDALADMVYELDLQVGKILAALEDPNGDGNTSDSILANTLILFTSDNGGLASERGIPGYDSTGILRGSKSSIYEGGHRVPFVAHWGDGTPEGSVIQPGSVSHQLIGAHDWVGLLYDLAGQSMAADQAMDCVNILPLLLGEQDEAIPVREFLILQSKPDSPYPYAIRQGDYVLLLDANKNAGALYNLAEDLSQETDLLAGTPSTEDAARSSQMRALYLQHDDPADLRSTPAYIASGSSAPLPDPAGFLLPPAATGPESATMTALTGTAANGPVEYYFAETGGNWGGTDSGWQTDPAFFPSGLLTDVTYTYTVTMRDASGQTGRTSPPFSVTPRYPVAPGLIPFFTEDFSALPGKTPDNAAPAENLWFLPLNAPGNSPQRIDESAEGSVLTSDGRLILGFGGDRVSVRRYGARTFDLSQDYRLTGDWRVTKTWAPEEYTSGERGFRAGIARFSSTGEIIGEGDARTAPESQFIKWTHINPASPVEGNSGTFSVTVTAEELTGAGVTPADRIGIVLYRNADNWPASGGGNDMYSVGPLALGYPDSDDDGLPDRFELTHGLNPNDPADALLDADGDGRTNLQEYIEGTDPNDPDDFFQTDIVMAPADEGFGISVPRPKAQHRYRLDFSTDLASGLWQTVDVHIPPSEAAPLYLFRHNPDPLQGFYRIRTERLP